MNLLDLKFVIPAVLLSLAAGIAFGYLKGRSVGEAEKLQETFEQLKERNVTNEDVGNMSDAERCAAINGVLKNGRCI